MYCIVTIGSDYLPLRPDCRILNFIVSPGIQEQCSYIEILDDDVIEPEEYFTVKLRTANPAVTLVNGEANVTIIDNDGGYTTTDNDSGYSTTDNDSGYSTTDSDSGHTAPISSELPTTSTRGTYMHIM